MKVENYASLSKTGYLFHILLHPVDGYHELKNNKKFSLTIANVLLGMWPKPVVSLIHTIASGGF